jgi:endoglucanase
VRAYENLTGRHIASVLWYQGWDSSSQPSFPCSDLVPVLHHDGYDTNMSFHLTWEPWVDLTDIANGIYDGYLTSYANEVKNCGLKVRLRFAHEMIQNDVRDGQEWYPWQDQPEQYKAAFRHVHDVFRAAGANNVEFVWCPQNWPFQLSIVQKYYPGPAYVDWLCVDGYKRTGSDWASEWFGDLFYNIYHTFVDNVSVFGEKPVMIGEFAACEGPVKPSWITDAFDQMKNNYPRIAAFYWFNINKECDWRVNSSPQSLAAFTTAISSAVFVSHPGPAVIR